MVTATPSVALVRLDQVTFHPHNVRQDLGDLRGLTASIKRHGVMQPIVVEKHAGRLRLRAGHRRTAAARLAGLSRIPAMIHNETLDEDEWLIASVQENVHRSGLTPEERLRTVHALLDLGCSRAGIAEAFGVSVGAVGNWVNPPSSEVKKKRARKIYVPAIQRRLFDWRERDADRDTILAELEQLIGASNA